MANQEHLNILKQGGQPWNSWRKANPTIAPDLSGVSLREFDLRMLDLSKCDLRSTDLMFQNIVETHFAEANLTGAHIVSSIVNISNFHKADLRGTTMDVSLFNRCDFRNADLAAVPPCPCLLFLLLSVGNPDSIAVRRAEKLSAPVPFPAGPLLTRSS